MTKLVGCAVFRPEAEHVLGDRAREITWLSPGLHADLDRLKDALERHLEAGETACLLAGCHPDLDRLLSARASRRLPGKDCVAVFLDDGQRARLEARRGFVMTPGWLEHWREIFQDALGWGPVDARQAFGRYEVVYLLDFGLAPLDDLELLAFFDFVQVPVEVVPASLDRFREAALALVAPHRPVPPSP